MKSQTSSEEPWAQYVERFSGGEWRTPIFRDMILADVRKCSEQPLVFLDIGCGSGFDLEVSFQKELSQCCTKYIGVEPDTKNCVAPVFHELHRTLFEDAPIESGSVHIAYSVMVLEHVRQPEQFCAKLWDVLAEGGVFWGFTVDARHYFSKASKWMERAKLKDWYLEKIYGPMRDIEYDHFPTYYLFNTPRQIRNHASFFKRCDTISFPRIGEVDDYVPRPFRLPARLLDRMMMAMGLPGSTLAVRLEK